MLMLLRTLIRPVTLELGRPDLTAGAYSYDQQLQPEVGTSIAKVSTVSHEGLLHVRWTSGWVSKGSHHILVSPAYTL